MQMLSNEHNTVTGFDYTKDQAPIPRKAIRLKCRECTNNQEAEIRRCGIVDCPLWPWRMGKRLSKDEIRSYAEELAANA